MVYTAKATVEVGELTVYADASGAPCVVRVADFAYAADYIRGQVTLSCIKHPGHGRRASEVAAERARRTYAAVIQERTTPAWREANIRLYSDD